jgi:Holliday junction resolvasome RuvABC endonuclease subunit
MTYLCLDLASQTGWCVIINGDVKASGTQSFHKKRGESNGIMFLRLHKWLADMLLLCDGKVDVCAYEQAHFRGGPATEICVGMQTHVQSWCASHSIESAPVPTQTLKKHATGKGTADKDAMIKKATEILGHAPADDNEADAVCIGMWAVENFGRYSL